MNNTILSLINFVAAQTQQEKNLTLLYVCLFVLLMGMLVLDTFAMKKWTPKGVHILLYVLLLASVIALILLLVYSKNG